VAEHGVGLFQFGDAPLDLLQALAAGLVLLLLEVNRLFFR
jgi:hypothetical protein